MEKDEEKIMNKIEEDIDSQSRLVSDAIEQEIATMRADQIDFFKEGLKKETDTYLEKELSDLRLFAATKASQDKLKTKRDLLALRTSLTDKLLEDVRADLEAFVSGSEYPAYLENRLKEIPVKEHGVFFARAEDTEAMKQILKRNGFDNEVRTEDIRIGGFRYEDVQNALEYDCCFEAALNDQLKWFRENSGFTVYRKEESK